MKSLVDFIYEWKDDLTPQIIIIMGTPGCGKTFWMQHNGVEFFKNEFAPLIDILVTGVHSLYVYPFS